MVGPRVTECTVSCFTITVGLGVRLVVFGGFCCNEWLMERSVIILQSCLGSVMTDDRGINESGTKLLSSLFRPDNIFDRV